MSLQESLINAELSAQNARKTVRLVAYHQPNGNGELVADIREVEGIDLEHNQKRFCSILRAMQLQVPDATKIVLSWPGKV